MTKVRPGARIDWRATSPAYVTGDDNYSVLHYQDGTSILIAVTIRLVTGHFSSLVRVRKNVAIESSYVKSWRRLPERRMVITLQDGNVIEVARRRLDEVVGVLTLNSLRDEQTKNIATPC